MAQLPRPVSGVGVVLQRADGQVAIGHRVTTGETPSWSFPGGHLEGGEEPVRAALRELAEETGVVADDGTVVAVCVRTAGSGVTFAVHVPAPPGAELVVTEPHAIDAWTLADPDALPEPVFAHTAAVCRAWRAPGLALAGWDLHPVTGGRGPGR